MPSDDLKQHVNSSQDFYALLEVEPTASEADIRRAYRQTARKYHPDKVGANNTAALEKFHQLQIAYDVLSDAVVKELYDAARRAREEQAARKAAFDGRRKAMIDELEARESGAMKRKRDEVDAEAKFEQELQRLAEDGKRRRLAREEQLRKEMRQQEEEERKAKEVSKAMPGVADDMDRTVAFRFIKNEQSAHMTQGRIQNMLTAFGVVEAVVLKEKRRKPPNSKHKVDYWTGLAVFETIVGAHFAVTGFGTAQNTDPDFKLIEALEWAAGQEPAAVPQTTPISDMAGTPTAVPEGARSTSQPKFSFSASRTSNGQEGRGIGLDETMMMRLRNAELRRLEAHRQQTTAE